MLGPCLYGLPSDTRALPVQIAEALRTQVTAGILLPGEQVPSTRALAAKLGVSRGSVVTAYEQLTAEGYLTAEVGSGTVVNPRLPHSQLREVKVERTAPAASTVRLTPGLPDTDGILTPEWRAAWREAANHPLSDATSLPTKSPTTSGTCAGCGWIRSESLSRPAPATV